MGPASVLALLAAVLTVVAVAIGAYAARDLSGTRHSARELARQVRREDGFRAEAARVDAWREPVVATTKILRFGHELVAGLSFGLLEQVPPTRRTATVVRAAHDSIADRVYAALLDALGDGPDAVEALDPGQDAGTA